jgi:hypothetical protein
MRSVVRSFLGWLLAAVFLASTGARAQEAPPPFKAEELDAMLAPVALYPDSLLMQLLMAATYPLDVVKAANWVKDNPNVQGDEAVKAVGDHPWDVSVKSLVAFPSVVAQMADKIDWTQNLGDAFLAQQKDVLDSIQRLRRQAHDAGNLKSGEQQKVVVEGSGSTTIVKIEPANPQVIYVPAYNPTVVYGVWAYPAYPPVYYPPPPYYYPGGALLSGFAWGLGFAAAGAIYSDCDWHHGDVDIDIDRTVNIDRNFDRTKIQGKRTNWQHNPQRRGGVAYRDARSQQRYGRNVPGAETRQQYRGRDTGMQGPRTGPGTMDRAQVQDRGGQFDRGRAPERAQSMDRAQVQDRAAQFDRGSAQGRAQSMDRGWSGDGGAFQGVGQGSQAQREFNRGHASNQSMQRSGFSGGGRAGGGGGGGRGGGGRGGGGRR